MTTETKLTTLKKASCPTLSQSGFIDYQISAGDKGEKYITLTSNCGSGYFSKTPQAVTKIIKALEDFEAQFLLTSLALRDLYLDTSVNSWSFMMAVLFAEGLVVKHPDNPRRFKLADTKAFIAALDKLQPAKGSHSAPRKGKARAKG